MKEQDGTAQEKQFILEARKQGYRIDMRQIDDFRPIQIQVGPQPGQAQVQLGNTRVFANVSSEIVRPSPANPTEGTISFHTEFSPMAFPVLYYDKSLELETMLSRILEKALRKSSAIDTEGLCIVAGEKVWSIRVDIRVLDHNGNVLDCACLAAMTALLHFKRPDVSVDGVDHSEDEKSPIPLSIHHIPICVTFSFFENGEYHVIDPNLDEETAQDGDLTFSFNVHQELCTISKSGGLPLKVEKVLYCAQIASTKAQYLTKKIKDALKKPLLNN